MEMKRGKIIAVTSGKGGVGKSSIVSNMAYILGTLRARTYILDADLSLGNIDIMFGMVPKFSIKDLLEGTRHLNEIVLEGPSGIKIIPATSGVSEFSDLSEESRHTLLCAFRGLSDYDYMIVDTSAGISSNMLYFNTISEEIIVVVTPDPASLTDSYATIKVLHKKTGRESFNIIVNMVKDEREALDVYRKLGNVTDKFLDVYLDYSGYIPVDGSVSLATRRQKLWAQHFPEAMATMQLTKICNKLMS
jgi:flagellar biosynthesis protein FlhG